MRDQYAGDVSDYLKFSFLRAVAPVQARLGIAWYYLSGHDGRADGRHEDYLGDQAWRSLDPELFDRLKAREERSVAHLEALGLLPPGTTFHRVAVSASRERGAWQEGMVDALKACDVVFADPDNGVSRVGVVSRKSATVAEVERLAAGRMLLLIRFPHRLTSHDDQLASYHHTFAAMRPITLRTCVRVPNANGSTSPRIRWFTALNPEAETERLIGAYAEKVAALPGAKVSIEQ